MDIYENSDSANNIDDGLEDSQDYNSNEDSSKTILS